MKIYTGLDFTYKWTTILQQCIQEAKKNPFTTYYIVTKDPLIMEEVLLRYTDALFNIEVVTLKHFLVKHTYQKVLTTMQKHLLLRHVLENNKDSLFYQPETMLSTITQLLQVFDTFHAASLTSLDTQNMPTLSKTKIEECYRLYQQFLQEIPTNTLYCALDITIGDSLSNQVLYIQEEEILTPKAMSLLTSLDTHNTIYILANYEEEDRLLCKSFAHYFKDQEKIAIFDTNPYSAFLTTTLFNNEYPKYKEGHPFSVMQETNPIEEVNSLCFSLLKQVVEKGNRYLDFAIYYPNPQYLTLLQERLTAFNIPYNEKAIPRENTIAKGCLLLLEYANTKDESLLIELLDLTILKKCPSFIQANYCKKQWLEYGFVAVDAYQTLKERFSQDYITPLVSAHSFEEYSQILIHFIENEVILQEQSSSVISVLKAFHDYSLSVSLTEFHSWLMHLQPSVTNAKETYLDHVRLYTYQQPYSGLLDVKKVFLVGLNETIVPPACKDQDVLLNREKEWLQIPFTIEATISTQQNQFLQILTTRCQEIVLSYSMVSMTGDTLLPSSYYLHISDIFSIPKLDTSSYYAHPALGHRFYSMGGRDASSSMVNTLIAQYLQTRNQPAPLTDPIATSMLSASQLEVYNGCHYKYYCQYGLQLQPFNSPILQPNEIGTLIHHVLETATPFFTNREVAKELDKEAITTHIHTTIENYIQATPILQNKLTTPSNQFFIQCVESDLYNTILVLKQHMKVSAFHVESTEEQVFKEYGDFKIKGFVDRMDVSSNYVKVIDYKSSNKDLDLGLALQGFNIQMLLYMDMLSKTKQLENGAVLYFNTKKRILKSSLSILEDEEEVSFYKQYRMNGYTVEDVVTDVDQSIGSTSTIIKAGIKKDGSYKGNVLDTDTFQLLLEAITKHIVSIYQEIHSGNIHLSPKGSNNPTIHTKVNPCSYCPYRAICNLDIFYNESTLVENIDALKQLGGASDV